MDKFFKVTVNGNVYDVKVEEVGVSATTVTESATQPSVNQVVETPKVEVTQPAPQPQTSGPAIEIKAPMPGGVWKILKRSGDVVKKNEPILILEVMKMENEIVAPSDGTIKEILVKESDKVAAGQTLIMLA